MDTIHISFMEQSDREEAARALSLAMLDNPLHVAVFQGSGEKERREIENMFAGLFNELPGIVFLAREGNKIIGVMRMKSCMGSPTTDKPEDLKKEQGIAARKSVWHREWADKDPKDQHWHLGPIGVLPSHQGRGIGSLLMERFCREVDQCSAKAYLETDLDKNVRFYEKFGFRVIAQSEIFQVNNRYMLRDLNV